ncbi:hypothetical protein [Bacillus manliponensis]|uniref:hypothetical protein n=1 Tax=Bacillus manliponensis TaxID=574376 RepID=UPI003519D07E
MKKTEMTIQLIELYKKYYDMSEEDGAAYEDVRKKLSDLNAELYLNYDFETVQEIKFTVNNAIDNYLN